MNNRNPLCCTLCCCLLWLCLPLSAQTVKQAWNKPFTLDSDGFEVTDAAITPDGEWIGIVGYASNGIRTFGQLLLINTHSKTRVEVFVKDRDNNNKFNGITVSDDGLFHIIGQISEPEMGEQGWWLCYDPYAKNEAYPDQKIGDKGKQYLEKIIWLGRSSGLAIGRTENKKEGNLWLLQITGNHIEPANRFEVGAEAVAQLAAALPVPGNDSLIWLCGTTRACKKSAKDNSWLIEVNHNGDWNQEAVFGGNSSQQEFVSCAAVNRQGDLLLAGGRKVYTDQSDPWLLLTRSGNNHAMPVPAPPSMQDDWISALTGTEDKELFLMLLSSQVRGSDYQYFVYYTGGDAPPYNSSNTVYARPDLKLNLPITQAFVPKRFLHPKGTKHYYLVGTSSVGSGSAEPYIIALEAAGAKGSKKAPADATKGKKDAPEKSGANGKSSSKGVAKPSPNQTETNPNITATEPQISLSENAVFTKNGGAAPRDVLMGGEGGAVKFYLTNNGSDMPSGGRVKVSKTSLTPGVAIKNNVATFSALEQGQKSEVITIGIRADANVGTGDSYFTIEVLSEDESKIYLSFQSPVIRSQGKEMVAKTAKPIEFTTPRERLGERVIETTSDTYRGEATITTTSPNLKQSKPVTVQANIQRPRSRSTQGKLSEPNQVDGKYVHNFEFTVDLDMDTNIVFLQLPDEMGGTKSSPITIIRKKLQPRLFVLSIGVPYDDHRVLTELEFTTKDAADFYDAMLRQADLGFFSEVVYKKLLNTAPTTTKDAIEKAFADLSNQQVRPEDYVMVFISSHGEARNNNPLILPNNYDGTIPSAVDYQSLVRLYLKGLLCKKFVFIDACHSGADGKSAQDAEELNRQIDSANKAAPDLISFKSSQGVQSSYEYKQGQNGVFTYALLEAIRGHAVLLCNKNGASGPELSIDLIDPEHPERGRNGISVRELAQFLSKRVPNLVGCLSGPHGDQIPTFTNEVPQNEDLTIFRYK